MRKNQNVYSLPDKDAFLKLQRIVCKETVCSEKLREHSGHSRSDKPCTLAELPQHCLDAEILKSLEGTMPFIHLIFIIFKVD